MSKGSNGSHHSMMQPNSMQMNNMRANESMTKRKSSYTPSAMSHKGYSVTGGNPNLLQRQSSHTEHAASNRSHKPLGSANQKKKIQT